MMFTNIQEAYSASKTALVGLSICFLATGVVLLSAFVDYLDYRAHPSESFSVPYVPELFLLYASIFTGIAAKNGVDNWRNTTKETQLEIARMTTTVTPQQTPPIIRRP